MELSVKDQLGDTLRISSPPRRIISLVPSQTELLSALGLDKEIVGITRFCVHPQKWFWEKDKIGGTKKFWFDKIDELQPDLIIGNKEENYQEGIVKLKQKYPVWMSDVTTMEDATQMIQGVGRITGRAGQSFDLINRIQQAFESRKVKKRKSVLYLIWRNPWMAAGRNTFINSMLESAGWVNCLSSDRYPEVSEERIRELSPELVFLSSEPYPFNDLHIEEVRKIIPSSRVFCVDGEMFSWYGSRLLQAFDYLTNLPV